MRNRTPKTADAGATAPPPDNLPYFDASGLEPTNRYVAWLDVMGSRAMMVRSLPIIANFVAKLHIASIGSKRPGQVLYPMNDGVFVVGDGIFAMKDFLRDCFLAIDLANRRAKDQTKIFMVRAGLAFGPVVEGVGLAGGSAILDDNPQVRNAVLLGAPVVQAFECESKASPFGIYVHESARTFAPPGGRPWNRGAFMRYWSSTKSKSESEAIESIRSQVFAYLDQAQMQSHEQDYPLASIARHRSIAAEYFLGEQGSSPAADTAT